MYAPVFGGGNTVVSCNSFSTFVIEPIGSATVLFMLRNLLGSRIRCSMRSSGLAGCRDPCARAKHGGNVVGRG